MPNWCENQLIISGKPEALKEFMEFARSGVDRLGRPMEKTTPLDFHKFIPYPEDYAKLDRIAREWERTEEKEWFKSKQKRVRWRWLLRKITFGRLGKFPWHERPKDGYNQGGYGWCCNNWGTKWNACDLVLRTYARSTHYFFNTAWSPPSPVVRKMAELYPDLRFKLKFWEMGAAYQGVFEIKDGEVITDITRDYHGLKGG